MMEAPLSKPIKLGFMRLTGVFNKTQKAFRSLNSEYFLWKKIQFFLKKIVNFLITISAAFTIEGEINRRMNA